MGSHEPHVGPGGVAGELHPDETWSMSRVTWPLLPRRVEELTSTWFSEALGVSVASADESGQGIVVTLAANGGPDLDVDEQWASYRRHCLHGLLWSVTPAWMQPAGRCRAMTERYVAAIEDHDSIGMLAR